LPGEFWAVALNYDFMLGSRSPLILAKFEERQNFVDKKEFAILHPRDEDDRSLVKSDMLFFLILHLIWWDKDGTYFTRRKSTKIPIYVAHSGVMWGQVVWVKTEGI
jgi:hypothetical protein